MSTETALPTAEQAQAGTQTEPPAPEKIEGQAPPEGEQTPKPEKTPEQREIEKLRRVIDRRTRRNYELQAQLQQQVGLPARPNADTTSAPDDDKPLTLTRKQLDALITDQASKLAPKIAQTESVESQRRTAAQRMVKELGQEKFEAYSSELDDVMGGMLDSDGNLKPVIEEIFESAMSAAILEHLADPENADEAEALGRMNARQAGRAMASLEIKLKAAADAKKAKAKPQPSDAPDPIERLKGSGQPSSAPADTDSVDVWVRKERARIAALKKTK